MRINKWLFLVVLAHVSFAQNTTTAKIKQVIQNGFHKITLPPAIRSFTREDLSNFRIYDTQNNEVPYFVLELNNTPVAIAMKAFPIVSESNKPGKNTTVIFENPELKELDQISLVIGNTDVVKKYSISGSNDNSKWFGIVNNKILTDITNTESITTVKTITFPLCSYRFLKIDFDDTKTLPIDLRKIGFVQTSTLTSERQLLPLTPEAIKTIKLSKQKKTLVHVVFKNKEVIDQLVLDVKSPAYYKRDARIYKKVTRKYKRKVKEEEQDIFYFQIRSDTKNQITIPRIFEKDFFIEISNQDNPPLHFSSIRFNQVPVVIVADLKSDETYSIKTGSTGLQMPQYDLANFKDKVPDQLPETIIYNIKQTNAKENQTTKKQFWQQSWFMWLCIAIGGIVIVYFSISLIKDLNKN